MSHWRWCLHEVTPKSIFKCRRRSRRAGHRRMTAHKATYMQQNRDRHIITTRTKLEHEHTLSYNDTSIYEECAIPLHKQYQNWHWNITDWTSFLFLISQKLHIRLQYTFNVRDVKRQDMCSNLLSKQHPYYFHKQGTVMTIQKMHFKWRECHHQIFFQSMQFCYKFSFNLCLNFFHNESINGKIQCRRVYITFIH